jgi:hypothetical protein
MSISFDDSPLQVITENHLPMKEYMFFIRNEKDAKESLTEGPTSCVHKKM